MQEEQASIDESGRGLFFRRARPYAVVDLGRNVGKRPSEFNDVGAGRDRLRGSGRGEENRNGVVEKAHFCGKHQVWSDVGMGAHSVFVAAGVDFGDRTERRVCGWNSGNR